jgi:hypothetical protein
MWERRQVIGKGRLLMIAINFMAYVKFVNMQVKLLTCLWATFLKIFNCVLLNRIDEVNSLKELFQFLRCCVE